MNGQVTGEPASPPWRQLWRCSGPLQHEIRKLLALDTFGPGSRWTLTLNSLLTELLCLMVDCSGHHCSITSLLLYSSHKSSTFAPARPNKELSLRQNSSVASKIRPQVNFTPTLTRGAAAKKASAEDQLMQCLQERTAAPPSAVAINPHSDNRLFFLHNLLYHEH